ncbi:DMT family transporter [Aquibium sp. ELW1220]|uniref:DMT family transporter n=1 Tax=Aquibium sp. ELW1220 TaxID=2976766 RepID=UPI0025B10756|nr:DMT family transporter [Aquibium sp. ELW1220]MDN2579536.1 DMT family transporter [Aquibium sp. ELW1220]
MTGPSADTGRAQGIALGFAATFCWAFYNVGTAIGRADGFSSADLAMLRFGVAAILLAPLLLLRSGCRAALPPRRIAVLTVLIGPPFAFLINTGYGIAPLAHAVVISPGVTMLTANALSALVGGRPVPGHRRVGIALLAAGLVAIATDQPATPASGTPAWIGDLCFVASGSLWGCFTWLVGRWQLPAMETTAAVSLSAALCLLPFYLVIFGVPDHPPAAWALQALYQGVLGGAVAIVSFAGCVRRLGAGTASLFPALLPPAAVMLAIPLAGEAPSVSQWLGVTLASAGLLVSLDIMRRR